MGYGPYLVIFDRALEGKPYVIDPSIPDTAATRILSHLARQFGNMIREYMLADAPSMRAIRRTQNAFLQGIRRPLTLPIPDDVIQF